MRNQAILDSYSVQSENLFLTYSCRQKVDDFLNGVISFAICGLQFAVYRECWVWLSVKQAVSQRAADALVEKDKHQSCFQPLIGKPVKITSALALQQSMSFEFSQIIAQLSEGVVFEIVSTGDQLMDVGGAPSRHLSATMEQNFHQPNHASVVDLDPWDFALARHNGQGQALEQSEVDMHVESLSLESREAVSDLTEDLTHRGEVIESFLQMKVGKIVAAHFASEESQKLFVLFDKGVLKVGSQDVMTVLDSLQGRMKLALELFADALAEELRDFVSAQKQKPQLAGTLEEVSNGKVALEDDVAAVFDLADGVEAMKVHRLSLPLREFWSQHKRPVIEPLADELWAKPIGSRLKSLGVGNGKKSVVVFAELDCGTFQFDLDEVMTVEPIGGVKGQEGSHSEHQGSQSRVADIKVVVGEAAAAFAQDLVIRISGGELGLSRAQGGSLLHALEDEIDSIALGSFHAAQQRLDKLFLLNPLLGPLDGNVMVSGKPFHPALVVVRPLSQHLFGNQRDAHYVVKEVNHVLRTRQHREITVDHDTVETVVNKNDQVAIQAHKRFHGPSSRCFV